VSTWIWAVIYPLLPFVFLLVPDGRLPSRRWLPLAWAVAACGGLVVLAVPFRAGPLEYFPAIRNPLGVPALTRGVVGGVVLVYFALLVPATGSLLARFVRARGDERQQLKWVAFAALFVGVEMLVGARWLPVLLHSILSAASLVGFAAAVAVAILKYRLYAIDRIINRALVYGLLTGVLGLGYGGAVLAGGQVLDQGRSDLAVAAATLAVAALFQPLRRRIQQAVDRRFNRRHYDAARTIGAFSARLREQIDLDSLTGELLKVAGRTMEPVTASLWRRQPGGTPARALTASGLELTG